MDELPTLDHRFAPQLSEIAVTRRLVRDTLATRGLEGEPLHDLLVVTSELVTNAVRHGGAGLCRLQLWFAGEARQQVVIEVAASDRPPGVVSLQDHQVADPLAEGGRGLVLVRAMCDDVEIEMRGRERYVRCRKRLAGAA